LCGSKIPIEKAIDVAAKIGFKAIEFSFTQYDIDDLSHLLKEKLKMNNLECSIHLFHGQSRIGLIDVCNPIVRKKSFSLLLKGIKVAKELNAKCLVFHPGNKYISDMDPLDQSIPHEIKDDIRNANIDVLKKIRPLAEKEEITIVIENLPGYYYGNDPLEIKTIVAELDSENIRCCFDVGHYYTSEFYNKSHIKIAEIIKNLNPFHIHCVDNLPGLKDEHLCLGEGNIDFEDFVQGLKAINYKQHIVFENQSIEDAVRSRKYLEKIRKRLGGA